MMHDEQRLAANTVESILVETFEAELRDYQSPDATVAEVWAIVHKAIAAIRREAEGANAKG